MSSLPMPLLVFCILDYYHCISYYFIRYIILNYFKNYRASVFFFFYIKHFLKNDEFLSPLKSHFLVSGVVENFPHLKTFVYFVTYSYIFFLLPLCLFPSPFLLFFPLSLTSTPLHQKCFLK